MLGGSIDIRSQVGQGTEVKISLPLMRVPGTETPISTPSTAGSFERPQDDSVSILQEQASGRSVAFYKFATKIGKEYQASETGNVLRKYVSTWFGLNALSQWNPRMRADIIIVDEKDLAGLLAENLADQSILVLCSNSSRHGQGAIQTQGSGVVELVSKPFGPYKLAKALRLCLERANVIRTGLESIAESSNIMSPRSDTLTGEFEELTLEGEDEHTPIVVQTNGTVIAGESTNAQMAMNSSSSAGGIEGLRANAGSDFPFPKQELNENSPKKPLELPADLVRRESRRPDLKQRVTDPPPKKRAALAVLDAPTTISNHGKMVTSPAKSRSTSATKPMPPMTVTPEGIKSAESRPPRILLVDDNKINLRLLETFMTKRKYQLVDSAENGLLAVQAAEMQEDGYDIIFMGNFNPPPGSFFPLPTAGLTDASRYLHAGDERLRSHARHSRHRSSTPQILVCRHHLFATRSDHRSDGAGVQS